MFSAVRSGVGVNLARHGQIRQSQLNSLWGWALVAQVSFMLIGYPWYTGNILFAFAVTGQALRWFSQPSRQYVLLAMTLGGVDTAVIRQLRCGRGGHAYRRLVSLSGRTCYGTAGIRRAVGHHGVIDEPERRE